MDDDREFDEKIERVNILERRVEALESELTRTRGELVVARKELVDHIVRRKERADVG